MNANEINQIIEKLNSIAGERGGQILEHATQCVFYDALFDFVCGIILVVFSVATAWKYRDAASMAYGLASTLDDSDFKIGFPMAIFVTIGYIAAVIMFWCGMSCLNEFPRLLSPESYAVMDVVKYLK